MAVHTVEDFENRLDEFFSWRRAELQALQGEVDRAGSGPGTPLARGIARAGVSLAYAHWEGYFRDSCQLYLDFVAKRRLSYAQLNDGFLISSVAALMRRNQSGDAAAVESLLELVRNPSSARARVPRTLVDTKSNLRSGVVSGILGSLGLDRELYSLKAHLIDKRLCDARNEIAHGRDAFPTAQEFREIRLETIEMMEELRSVLLGAVRAKSYTAGVLAG